MKRSRFTTELLIAILQQDRAGAKAEDLGRRHGFSPGTLYVWKQRFGSMVVSDAKRLTALERENARLRRLVADQALNLLTRPIPPLGRGLRHLGQILKDVLAKGESPRRESRVCCLKR
jgi:putative transposase